MSWRNKIIWSEGMFMRPQHFQQEVRYIENYVEQRCSALHSHAWGIKSLKIDSEALTLGKFRLEAAAGVLPDGTPFNFPDNDEPPIPIDIDDSLRNSVIYLSLPIRRAGMKECDFNENAASMARYKLSEYEVRDSNADNDNLAPLQVGKLRLQLLTDSDQRAEYACIGIARVQDVNADKKITLDSDYIPSLLDIQSCNRLIGYLDELKSLLHHRGNALAARVSESGKGGVAEIADFMMLLAVNRYEPLVIHMSDLKFLHPESVFNLMLMLAGELSTFTNAQRRPADLPSYTHDNLQLCIEPVMSQLRQSLSAVLEQTAMPIPLEEKGYGVSLGILKDRSLLDHAVFVLAVSASIPVEDIRSYFPTQVKIGSPANIRELVNLQLPGIKVHSISVAPRQIPYHAGYVYFQLDKSSDLWKDLKQAGTFAIHVGGEYPGLEMEFWAIRG